MIRNAINTILPCWFMIGFNIIVVGDSNRHLTLGCPTKILYSFLIYPIHVTHSLSISSMFTFLAQYVKNNAKNEAHLYAVFYSLLLRFPLRYKYSSHHTALYAFQLCYSFGVTDEVSNPYKTQEIFHFAIFFRY